MSGRKLEGDVIRRAAMAIDVADGIARRAEHVGRAQVRGALQAEVERAADASARREIETAAARRRTAVRIGAGTEADAIDAADARRDAAVRRGLRRLVDEFATERMRDRAISATASPQDAQPRRRRPWSSALCAPTRAEGAINARGADARHIERRRRAGSRSRHGRDGRSQLDALQLADAGPDRRARASEHADADARTAATGEPATKADQVRPATASRGVAGCSPRGSRRLRPRRRAVDAAATTTPPTTPGRTPAGAGRSTPDPPPAADGRRVGRERDLYASARYSYDAARHTLLDPPARPTGDRRRPARARLGRRRRPRRPRRRRRAASS